MRASPENAEYLRLVALQLKSGKLGLTTKPRSGSGVFVVGKKAGSSKLREVCVAREENVAYGSVAPDTSPSAFAMGTSLEASACVEAWCVVLVCDQAKAPVIRYRWFAKPPVQTRELLALGVVFSGRPSRCSEGDWSGKRFAAKTFMACQSCVAKWVSRGAATWRSGSSAVSVLSQVCHRSMSLLMTHLFPVFCEAFALAAEDSMFFSNSGVGRGPDQPHG